MLVPLPNYFAVYSIRRPNLHFGLDIERFLTLLTVHFVNDLTQNGFISYKGRERPNTPPMSRRSRYWPFRFPNVNFINSKDEVWYLSDSPVSLDGGASVWGGQPINFLSFQTFHQQGR